MHTDSAKTFAKGRGCRQGFSMVEIMIVLGIVGILLAVAVPSYKKARTDAKRKEAQAELQMLATAIRQLMWDTHFVPNGYEIDNVPGSHASNDEVSNLGTAGAGILSASSAYVNWKGPYLRKLEKDPWGSNYFFDPDYEINGGTHRVVGSFGPNRTGLNVYDSDNICIILE
ncbi:MAG: prepilin-type N-terminal cleavage/methylation domain-containing protein [Lentisphaerae bacterium]|nr:prepilin-type N-terminal cleavage/methylation domain-containing protein [Lentisphaerota bacterium]